MLGKRRPLGTRIDSQRNVDVAANKLGRDSKEVLNLVDAVAEKKPTSVKPARKQRTYDGRLCLVPENVADDIDSYMKFVEKKRQLDKNFLKNTKVDGRMRGIMLDWIMQVQVKFRLTAETFCLSCYILDRIIAPLEVNRKNFQLIGLGCVFVASKFEEIIIPNVHDFVFMGGEFCTISNLFWAEQEVLRALKFELLFVYPNHFLRKMRMMISGPDDCLVYEISKLLMDIYLLDYNICTWLPSEAAAASVCLGYKMLRITCPTKLLDAVGVSVKATSEKATVLANRLSFHVDPAGKLKALRSKYKNTDALRIVDQYMKTMKNHT